MLTKLQHVTAATPEHSHSLGNRNYFDLRLNYARNIPKMGLRGKSTKHTPSLRVSRHLSKKQQTLREYYYWEIGEKLPLVKDISESYWKLCLLKELDEDRHAWKTTHPESSLFIKNWSELIAKDAPPKPPPKIPKTKDWKARIEFAKSIGLSELPSQSDDSFKQLYGLFDGIMKYDNEHDSVESVRRIRRQ